MQKIIEIKPDEIVHLPLKFVDLDPEQPRKTVPEEYIDELALDIKKTGVLQPVIVRPNTEQEGRYIIVYGECRYRGSKQAKKRSIPAILDQINKGELDRLINQVKENHQRRPLNPMEMSSFLKKLRDKFGMKSQKKIEDTLKAHGINNMSRSYISNIIRLQELPDWIQQLISNGKLTAAHGKYILPALVSDTVMSDLKEKLDDNTDISTRELQGEIFDMFDENHNSLQRHWITPFDYKVQCVESGCQKMRKMNNGQGGNDEDNTDTYCLDSECHAEKVSAYRELKKIELQEMYSTTAETDEPTEPKEFTADEKGVVDVEKQELYEDDDYYLIEQARFEKQECIGCEHCFQVKVGNDDIAELDLKEACFNIPCYNQKESEFFALEEQARVAFYSVKDNIRQQISISLSTKPALLYDVLSWIVCGRPSPVEDGAEYDDYLDTDLDTEEKLNEAKLNSLEAFVTGTANSHQDILAAQASAQLCVDELIYLTKHLKLSVEGYRINDEYLRDKTSDQLLDLLKTHNIIDEEIQEKYADKDLAELYQLCLDSADDIGVPAGIQDAWTELTKENDNA